jgi:hypothetical protein
LNPDALHFSLFPVNLSVIGSSVWLTHGVPPHTVVSLEKPSLRIKSPDMDGVAWYQIGPRFWQSSVSLEKDTKGRARTAGSGEGADPRAGQGEPGRLPRIVKEVREVREVVRHEVARFTRHGQAPWQHHVELAPRCIRFTTTRSG